MGQETDHHSFERGKEMLARYLGWTPKREELDTFSEIQVTHLFGNIWTRDGLSLRERSMITLAALIMAGREDELRIHLRGALNIGIEPKTIEEMFIHLANYGGVPVARSGWNIAREVLERTAKSART